MNSCQNLKKKSELWSDFVKFNNPIILQDKKAKNRVKAKVRGDDVLQETNAPDQKCRLFPSEDEDSEMRKCSERNKKYFENSGGRAKNNQSEEVCRTKNCTIRRDGGYSSEVTSANHL